MTNIYALFLGVITSASLMAAYGDPSSVNPGSAPGTPGSVPGSVPGTPGNPASNPSYNQGSYNQRSPSYDQGTNPNYNQGSDSSHYPDANSSFNRNPQLSDNNDYRVNVQRENNAQSTYSNQSTYTQKAPNGNNDAQVLTQIQDRIKGAYKQYNINVNVSNGVATLSGVVNSQLDKDAIEKDIRNVPGITKVNNQLTIQR